MNNFKADKRTILKRISRVLKWENKLSKLKKFSEVNQLHGFDIIALSPHKKLNTKRSGRSSGGILVAVKRSLTQYFCLVKQTSDYMGKNS